MGFTVKAMVLTGIRKVAIVEQPAPALQYPMDVLLNIIRATLCVSGMPHDTQNQNRGIRLRVPPIPKAMSAVPSQRMSGSIAADRMFYLLF